MSACVHCVHYYVGVTAVMTTMPAGEEAWQAAEKIWLKTFSS